MPIIPQFNMPQGENLQPNDMAASTAREAGVTINRFGQESGRALGGAISRVGQQVGQAVDLHNTMQAISQGSATYSSLFGDLTGRWNQIASQSDPNDTSVQQGFSEKVLEPSLTKFTASFDNATPQAQEWAMQRANEMRQHFVQKTSADMTIRAADAAHQNITNSVQNYSGIVTADPTALGHSLQSFTTDLAAQLAANPYLDASSKKQINDELVPAAKWEITKNALWAMGKSNPDQLKQDLVTGKMDAFIPGQYKAQALQLADTAKRDFDNQQYIDQQRQQRDLEIKQRNNFGQSVGTVLAGQSLPQSKISEMARNGDISGEMAENLAGLGVKLAKMHQDRTESISHPIVFTAMANSIREQQMSNNLNMTDQPIWDAFNSGNLSKSEFMELRTMYANASKPYETAYNKLLSTTERAIGSSIQINAMKMSSPDQYATDLNLMRQDSYNKLNEWRNEGKDLTPLMDPKSPDYLFKNASAYFTPAAKVMQTEADKIRNPAAQTYQVGQVQQFKQGSFRYKGGDPSKQTSWEPVNGK